MAHLPAAAVVSSESSIRFHAPLVFAVGASHLSAASNSHPGAEQVLVEHFALDLAGMCRGFVVTVDQFIHYLTHPPG